MDYHEGKFHEERIDVLNEVKWDDLWRKPVMIKSRRRRSIPLFRAMEPGNPNDAVLFPILLDRQEQLYDRALRQGSADGGFASPKKF
jgi:hypothetical protein